jgi:protein-disulfide isomerase
MKEYEDKTLFVYKHFPLGIHPEANGAALASECALEQDKFWEYADKLYSSQEDWSTAKNGTQKFKEYARTLKLDIGKFNQCLDDNKYQSKIDSDVAEANEFGISGTPATFINNQFINGVVGTDDLKTVIDEELER